MAMEDDTNFTPTEGDDRLVDRTISDLASFQEHTTGTRALAGLYAFLKMDVLVDIAHKVSLHYFAHPELYRDPSVDEVVGELATLHARYGCDEHLLSREQRHGIFAALFGDEVSAFSSASGSEREAPYKATEAPPSSIIGPNGAYVGDDVSLDGQPAATAGVPPEAGPRAGGFSPDARDQRFGPERDQLLAATAAFAERVFNTGERPLRDAVGVMAPGFKSYLEDQTHSLVRWCRDEALATLTEDTSYKILRNPGIARAWRLEPPSALWPYREEGNGTTLVEVISRHVGHEVSRTAFIGRQRVALRGAEAIATILDFPEDSDVGSPAADLLISKCYTWYAARGRSLGVPLAMIAVVPGGEANSATVEANRGLFPADDPGLLARR